MAEEDKQPELEGPPEPEPEKPKPPEWEYKTEFGINSRMRDLIDKSKEFAELELSNLRRKLDRLTYGS